MQSQLKGSDPLNYPHRQSGFTLLEVVVVTAIIGVMAAMLLTNMTGNPAASQVQEEAERLQAILQLASDDAVMNGRDLGLVYLSTGYEFRQQLVVSADSLMTPAVIWEEMFMSGPLIARQMPEELTLELSRNNAALLPADPADEDSETEGSAPPRLPEVIFSSTGLVTPTSFSIKNSRRRASEASTEVVFSIRADGRIVPGYLDGYDG